MREKILIVEDETHISGLISYNLTKSGYTCTVVDTGEDVLPALTKEPSDLIILDIMLPGMDGFEVLRVLKAEACFSSLPIIILTAKGEEIDRIVGLELGVDDYVIKPFSMRELNLRVKNLLKRSRQKDNDSDDTLTLGVITVNISTHKVTVLNSEIELTHMEFNLLKTLIKKRGRVQSREYLLDTIWDIASDVTTRTVDTHIKRLRKKLGSASALIETVRGVGYRAIDKE